MRSEEEKMFFCRVSSLAYPSPFTSSGAFCYRGRIVTVARSPFKLQERQWGMAYGRD